MYTIMVIVVIAKYSSLKGTNEGTSPDYHTDLQEDFYFVILGLLLVGLI